MSTIDNVTTDPCFELVIRLQCSRGNRGDEASARLRAQALVKDILVSKLGVEPEIGAQEYVQAQGFKDAGKAFSASRALQTAFEGFRTALPPVRTNIAVLLDACPPEEAPRWLASPSLEQKELLNSAKSCQVLITQAFYERIGQFQPPLRSSPQRAGVYEFLWTDEQRLNQLQAESALMPVLVEPAKTVVADLDATIVIGREPITRSEPISEPLRPPLQAAHSVTDDEEEDNHQPSRSLKWVIAGGLVILLVAASFLIISHLLSSNHPTAKSPTGAHSQTKTPPRPEPKIEEPPHEPPTPPGVPEPRETQPRKDPDKKPIVPTTLPKPRGDCETVTDWLKIADSRKGRGDYDGAIRFFNRVLACEPHNPQAVQGLRNAKAAQDEH
jgi:hypothetical protein